MSQPPNHRLAGNTAAILCLLVAAPLIALVATIVVRAFSVCEDRPPRNLALVAAVPATTETVLPATPVNERAAAKAATTEETIESPAVIEAARPEPPTSPAVVIAEPRTNVPATENGPPKDKPAEAITKLGSSQGIFVEEVSKETYDALEELRAVLASRAWDDAAELVSSYGVQTASGLAPYLNDRALLTSLPAAIELAREDYPELRQALNEKLGPIAKLRIADAMRAGSAEAVEFAAVQFAGSSAAAEAHRWLGDRALASGQFAKAIEEYEKASRVDSTLKGELRSKVRLAAAMLGRDDGQPVTKPVEFGEVKMSPEAFEALIAEMRQRAGTSTSVAFSELSSKVPLPSGFDTHIRSRLDGPTGERPQDDLGRGINKLRVPWADRQLATVVEGDVMYVSNRFQVAAYNLESGQRVWQSQTPPGAMQRSQEWGLIPMRPLIVGERIYVRLLYSASPLLVCLDKATGKIVWISESREREFFVSDPLLIDGQLLLLAVEIQADQQGILRHYTFDPRTGEAVAHHDLVKLRNSWGARACCETAPIDGGLAAALGGVVVAVNTEGKVRWLRTQTALPADDNARWVLQVFQRPLVKDGRLYVAQPGVRSVECVAAATGRQIWSTVLSDIVAVVGFSGDLLVIRTQNDVRGLELRDGTTKWRLPIEEMLGASMLDDERLLVASREHGSEDNGSEGNGSEDKRNEDKRRWRPRLTWVDPSNGKPLVSTALSKLADDDPRLGPLVAHQDRLFVFFGRGQTDPTREVVELTPQGRANLLPVSVRIGTADARRRLGIRGIAVAQSSPAE